MKKAIKKILSKIFGVRIHKIEKNSSILKPIYFGDNFRIQEDGNELTVYNKADNATYFLRKKGSDIDVFKQVVVKKEYNIISDYFLSNNVIPENILDLGGNIGLTAKIFSIIFPSASIVSLEPDEENFKQLKKNCTNVVAHHKAIWSSSTRLSLYRDFRDGQDWSIQTKNAKNAAADENSVEATTVEILMAERNWKHIDFLKMDIEGAEAELLASEYKPDFLEHVRVIAVEIHDEYKMREVIYKRLKDYSFILINSGELTVGLNKKHLVDK